MNELSSPVLCVLLCLCSMTEAEWLLLWVVGHPAKTEASELGVSVRGMLG